MRKNTLTGIIILMSVSLVGIILIQVLWMKNAIEVKEKQFDQAANEALSATVSNLTHRQSVSWATNELVTDADENEKQRISGQPDTSEEEENNEITVNADHNESHTYTYVVSGDKPEMVMLRSGKKGNVAVSSNGSRNFVFTSLDDIDSLKKKLGNDEIVFLSEFTDSVNVIVERKISQISNRSKSMNEALSELVYEINTYDKPANIFFDQDQIQNVLLKNLKDKGIDLDFEFAVFNPESDSMTKVHSEAFGKKPNGKVYRTRLFPESLFNKPDLLLLTFPGRSMHIFRSLGLLFTGSFLFTLIILVTFFVTIRVILRQKKISEIKSDFINNMTHEFKTPIATISLAVDSINNSRVIGDPEKIRYFTGIINDENKRMNTSVENVLQMSLIDKKDFEFHPEPVDFHELIRSVAKHLQLQIEKKEGEFVFHLNAANPVMNVDKMHFTNVVSNLIDNAIKYAEKPVIELQTSIIKNHFVFRVHDNGRGLSKEEQDKIFEKFYRVSSGNIHNVKGFGLGLSYVKAIILATGGQISVQSKPGNGSVFTIQLPLNTKENNAKS